MGGYKTPFTQLRRPLSSLPMGISASKVIVFGFWTGLRIRWLKQPKIPAIFAKPGTMEGIFGMCAVSRKKKAKRET